LDWFSYMLALNIQWLILKKVIRVVQKLYKSYCLELFGLMNLIPKGSSS